jgi:8-oxo-dGTP diphosphatase
MAQAQPGVGIGVYVRKEGKLLLGKRLGSYGTGTWGAPGGKLEMWESPEECAVREVKEETGMEVQNLRFVGVVDDQDKEHGTHYITISYVADWKEGEPAPEPGGFEEWRWFSAEALPEPKFFPLRNFFASGYNPLAL